MRKKNNVDDTDTQAMAQQICKKCKTYAAFFSFYTFYLETKQFQVF